MKLTAREILDLEEFKVNVMLEEVGFRLSFQVKTCFIPYK